MNGNTRTISSQQKRTKLMNIPDEQLTQVLIRHLQQQLQLLNDLNLQLETERDHIKSRQLNEMQSVLTIKQQLLDEIRKGASQRKEWLSAAASGTPKLNGSDDLSLWKSLLKRLNNSELDTLWSRFTQDLSSLKDGNEINGKLISRGQQTMKRLLELMRGQSMTSVKLYNQSGSALNSTESHTSIKC